MMKQVVVMDTVGHGNNHKQKRLCMLINTGSTNIQMKKDIFSLFAIISLLFPYLTTPFKNMTGLVQLTHASTNLVKKAVKVWM